MGRVFLEPLRSARQLSRSWSVAGAHVQAVKQGGTNNDTHAESKIDMKTTETDCTHEFMRPTQ